MQDTVSRDSRHLLFARVLASFEAEISAHIAGRLFQERQLRRVKLGATVRRKTDTNRAIFPSVVSFNSIPATQRLRA